MSHFIKLTLWCDCKHHEPIFVNMDRVETMRRITDEDEETSEEQVFTVLNTIATGMEGEDDLPVILVEEAPEEILRMMQENPK